MAVDPLSAALLASAGTSVVGGLLGRSSAKRAAASQRQIAEAMMRAQRLQEEMIRKYEGIAEPFRETLYPQILDILSGESDLTTNPMYSISRLPLEQQYSRARTALEGRPGGSGALTRALARLEATRASEVGGIPSRLYAAMLGPGLGIASGKPELAVQGYGDIARTNVPLLGMYQQGIDSGTGLLAGSGELLGETLFNYLSRDPTVSSPGMLFNSVDSRGGVNLPPGRY